MMKISVVGLCASGFLIPITSFAQAIAEVPQWVYDQLSDPSVSVINMPQGTYRLLGASVVNGAIPLGVYRSNVTVNFKGFTLQIDPAEMRTGSYYPFVVAGVSDTFDTFPPIAPGRNAPTRYISQLSGLITKYTTQLAMDSNEVVDVQPGEKVLIWAGVSYSDPYEPESFIPATIASVDPVTHVITFTAPLGEDITNYGSLANLATNVDPSMQFKIGEWGTWPTGADFSKGYGVNHGMERFVNAGGMPSNVTLNDLTMNIAPETDPNLMPFMWDVAVIAASNVTINNLAIQNPQGNSIHLWRSSDILLNGVSFTGAGSSKIYDGVATNAQDIDMWGVNRITMKNISISGTDQAGFNTEIEPDNITLDGFNYNVTYTGNFPNYPQGAMVFGFQTQKHPPLISNARITTTMVGGLAPTYTQYDPLTFNGELAFLSPLVSYFDWGYQRHSNLNSTIVLDGVRYGPPVTETKTVTIPGHGNAFMDAPLPRGVYTAIQFQVPNMGDIRDISDSFGNHYTSQAQSGGWVQPAPSGWFQIAPYHVSDYMNKYLRFWENGFSNARDGSVTLQYTYLPVSANQDISVAPPHAPAPAPTPLSCQ